MTETAEPPARPIETELKYRVADMAAAERYLSAPTVGPFSGNASTRSIQMEDRYVDTADGAFRRAGFAVRLRITGTGTIVSVKSRAKRDGAGGAMRREELEGPADRALGAFEWPASDARSLVLELGGDAPLVEIVTVRQVRRRRQLRDRGTRVELSLDDVDVVVRGRVVGRFVELEAELLQGNEALLEGLAASFDRDPALARSTSSKLDSALAAVQGTASAPPAAGPSAAHRAEADEPDEAGLPVAEVAAAEAEVADAAAPEPDADPPAEAEAPTAAEGTAEAEAPEPAHDPVAEIEAAIAKDEQAAHEEDLLDEPIHDEDSLDAELGGIDDADIAIADGSEVVISELVDEAAAADTKLVVGKTAGVTAEDHVAEAGRKVLRFHLARMLAREPGTRMGVDLEELHGMRVATRRQRAAWRVFGDSFRRKRTRRYRSGLREIGARLGAVRDLDVLLEAADHYRKDLSVTDQRALEPLLADWRGHRDDALVLLTRELDSEGYQRWVEDYREFVRTDGAAVLPVGPVQAHRVRDTAPSAIWAAYQQVRAYEPVLRWADIETLHELRIAAKWLRYSLEFVREALGPESAPLIARVTALQDHLGLMHDADVAASMARAFLVAHAGDLSTQESAAIGRYLVSCEREVTRLRRSIAVPWRGVAGIGFRRGLGRVVAGL
jgi:CHAD domain-containing protein